MTDAPLDTRLDRRAFLTRMAAASSLAAIGAAPLAEASPRLSAVAAPLPGDLDDLTELTLAQTAAAIRQRRISSEEAVRAHLERIERFEETYLAFNTVLAEQALARARELDRRSPAGVIHGVPIVVKDNYWTKGVETTANSHIFEGFVPDEDATCVARLLDAGAVIIGKTQMGPLATTRATTPDGVVTTVNSWTPGTPVAERRALAAMPHSPRRPRRPGRHGPLTRMPMGKASVRASRAAMVCPDRCRYRAGARRGRSARAVDSVRRADAGTRARRAGARRHRRTAETCGGLQAWSISPSCAATGRARRASR